MTMYIKYESDQCLWVGRREESIDGLIVIKKKIEKIQSDGMGFAFELESKRLIEVKKNRGEKQKDPRQSV